MRQGMRPACGAIGPKPRLPARREPCTNTADYRPRQTPRRQRPDSSRIPQPQGRGGFGTANRTRDAPLPASPKNARLSNMKSHRWCDDPPPLRGWRIPESPWRGPPPPSVPPHKGEGGDSRAAAVPASPSPLWGGIKGGGGPTLSTHLPAPLPFTPLPRFRHSRVTPHTCMSAASRRNTWESSSASSLPSW